MIKFPTIASLLLLQVTLSSSSTFTSDIEKESHHHDRISSETQEEDDEYYNTAETELSLIEHQEDDYFNNLVKRMKPTMIPISTSHSGGTVPTGSSSSNSNTYIKPPPKQFFHLHHMKSGGTSLSSFISCGISRLIKLYNKQMNPTTNTRTKTFLNIPQYRLSECSSSIYKRCTTEPDNEYCKNQITNATVMTYCAPLAAADYFHWDNYIDDRYQIQQQQPTSKNEQQQTLPVPSVTMMRNPIDRVWSMYRFQTKGCFKCKPLIEVYNDILNNNTDAYPAGVCLPQLMNHITRNLLRNLTFDELNSYDIGMTDIEKVNDAIHSIKNRFSVVGVIERLEESIELFGYTFPWLSVDLRNIESFGKYHNDDDSSDFNWDVLLNKSNHHLMTDREWRCEFPHSNASPQNNRCGTDGKSHMDIPSQPDEETRKMIERFNMLDMKVYEAALEHFELQKKVMDMDGGGEADVE